jgi:hypothetical protein
MVDNTDEKHLDIPTNIKSENPSDEITPTADTVTITQNQETENMETHAQELHKAPGHGLKHYLFEFLMLFLAVFCGFLAENYRESRVERERAHELVGSFLVDLQHDTAQLNMLTKFRGEKEIMLDNLIFLLQKPPETIDRNSFYTNLFNAYNYSSFSQSTGTISQLKNAGYLRYFSDNDLIRLISNYEFFVQDYKTGDVFQNEFYNNNFRDFLIHNRDIDILTDMLVSKKAPVGTGILFYNADGVGNLISIINQLKIYNYTQSRQDARLKSEAIKLIDYLHRQFHLK